MEISIDFLLGVIAFGLSAVVVICCDGLYKLKKKWYTKSQKKQDALVIFTALTSELKEDEWIFVDTLPDALFLHSREDVKKAFHSYFKNEAKLPFSQVIVIEGLVKAFEKEGLLQKAEVVFSRENLLKYPDLFDSLPAWRREECQAKLLVSQDKNFGEKLVQVRKMPKGETSVSCAMKDIGMNAMTPLRKMPDSE